MLREDISWTVSVEEGSEVWGCGWGVGGRRATGAGIRSGGCGGGGGMEWGFRGAVQTSDMRDRTHDLHQAGDYSPIFGERGTRTLLRWQNGN